MLAWSAQAQDAAILLVPDKSELQRLSASEPRGLCFRGRPLPECSSFFITEAEVGYVLFGPDLHSFPDFVFGLDVGLMRNLSPHDAVGISAGASNRYVTLGPRYRRWLSDKVALDVGLSAAWEPGRIEIVELHTAIMYGDRVGLWVNAAPDFGRGEHALALGIRAGSEAGLVTYGAAATAVIIVVVGLATGVIVIST